MDEQMSRLPGRAINPDIPRGAKLRKGGKQWGSNMGWGEGRAKTKLKNSG